MSVTEPASIWVVASTMIDMISYMDRVPAAGETITGNTFSLGFGGKGANQAVMAKRLGASVAVINCLGTDVFGDMTVENFEREGIDIAGITRTSAFSSGVAPIWVDPSGTNRIVVIPGANLLLTPYEAATCIRNAHRVDLVLGQFEMLQESTAAAFRAGHDRGAICMLNPAPAAKMRDDLLAVTDWIVPNEIEFADIASSVLGYPAHAGNSDDIVALARYLNVRVAVTVGERGVALCTKDFDVTYIEPPHVGAVDTTGAGDAFVGAFAYGIASRLDEVEAIRLGCGCAAVSVTRTGTQSSFPRGEDLDEVRARARGNN